MLGAAIVLVITYFLTRKAQEKQRAKHLKTNDPRQNVVNDSSYNINREGIDGHRDQNLSEDEARRAVDDMKEGGTLPSDEEFHELRKDIKREDK